MAVDEETLNSIDSIVAGGRAVVSGSDEDIAHLVKEAINSGRSVSFYLAEGVSNAVKSWYWTPEREQMTRIAPISAEERNRIESELGLKDIGSFRYAAMKCGNCGQTYGAVDFLRQGIREHGLDAVRATFGLANSVFLRANPHHAAICANCGESVRSDGGTGGGWYDCEGYGGCCMQG